jgi:hypothetical protein
VKFAHTSGGEAKKAGEEEIIITKCVGVRHSHMVVTGICAACVSGGVHRQRARPHARTARVPAFVWTGVGGERARG